MHYVLVNYTPRVLGGYTVFSLSVMSGMDHEKSCILHQMCRDKAYLLSGRGHKKAGLCIGCVGTRPTLHTWAGSQEKMLNASPSPGQNLPYVCARSQENLLNELVMSGQNLSYDWARSQEKLLNATSGQNRPYAWAESQEYLLNAFTMLGQKPTSCLGQVTRKAAKCFSHVGTKPTFCLCRVMRKAASNMSGQNLAYP